MVSALATNPGSTVPYILRTAGYQGLQISISHPRQACSMENCPWPLIFFFLSSTFWSLLDDLLSLPSVQGFCSKGLTRKLQLKGICSCFICSGEYQAMLFSQFFTNTNFLSGLVHCLVYHFMAFPLNPRKKSDTQS